MKHFKLFLILSIGLVVAGIFVGNTAENIFGAIYFTGFGIMASNFFIK